MLRVLVIDDNAHHRVLTRHWLESLPSPFAVSEAGDAAEGLAKIAAEKPDCVLLDHILPPSDGLQVLDRVRRLPDAPPVVLLTCALTEELRRNALALGAAACLDKAMTPGPELVHAVVTAIVDRKGGKG